jgi:putative sigma-54 modulation protein
MNVKFRELGYTASPSFREMVTDRIAAALGRFAQRIRTVTVQFQDTNGPRGGIDKLCGIAVRLEHGDMLRAQDVNTQMAAAFYYALDRAAFALRRDVERRRNRPLRCRRKSMDIESRWLQGTE